MWFYGCISSRTEVKKMFDPASCTYTNGATGFSLTLPCEKGWLVTPLSLKGEDRHMLLSAMHQGKLIDLVVTCEPINSDLEDYLFMVKNQMIRKQQSDPNQAWNYRELESAPVIINGSDAIKYIYEADLQSQVYGCRTYVFVNALFKNREFNYRLLVYTPAEVYSRKAAYIEQIVNGFRILP